MQPFQLPNDEIAKKISDTCLHAFGELEDSVRLVQLEANSQTAQSYRQAIGSVLGTLVLDVLAPLYAAHPQVKPDSWQDLPL